MPLTLKLRGKVWYITGSFDGRPHFRSTGFGKSQKGDAENYLAKYQARLIEERIHGPKHAITFAECAKHYLETGGEATYLEPLILHLGDKRMHEITGADLVNVCKRVYPKCKPVSWRRFVYTPVSAIYRRCAADEMCDLKIFKAPDGKTPPVNPPPESWFDKFLEAAARQQNGARVAGLVTFMSYTAARVSEAIRVTPEDLEEIDGTHYATLRLTKPGTARRVVLHEEVVEALAKIEMTPGKPIFGFSTRWAANQAIERICKRAGIPYFSSHKVGRHTFAKRVLDAGHSLATLQEAGGWQSYGAVSRNYKHLETSAAHQAVLGLSTKRRQKTESEPENQEISNASAKRSQS